VSAGTAFVTSPAPAEAEVIFGPAVQLAARYAEILATSGVTRGLIGPREVGRIWPRHLLNCAVVTDLLPRTASVVDVGSGAGLPGLVMAIRRPDLSVTLLEPLKRRVEFLAETVAGLGLSDRVVVVHGRAEDPTVRAAIGSSSWVTARAVAPLDRLVRWCLPLLRPGGTLLAMKGASAADELGRHRQVIADEGGQSAEIVQCGDGLISELTTVIVVRRSSTHARRGK
jgi:16S rRNA (guanine527-N7)-methyltransferase